MNDKINPEKTPSTKNQTAFSKSWFFKYILNNRYTGALMVGILIVIFVSLFTRVSYLLDPAVSFIQYVSLPIIVAAIFYYLTVPLVNRIEKRGLNRTWGSAIVLLLIAVVVTGLVALIPAVADEGRNLIDNWDTIWTDYQSRLQTLIRGDWYDQVNMVVQSAMSNVLDLSSFNWESIANSAITSVSSIVGTVTRVAVAIFTAPIILFYMLRDGHKLPTYFAQFLPIKIRNATLHLLSDMNLQISQYIRGQIIVAIGVAIMFVVGYSIVGLPYGVIIGVAAGFLNVIPYVGSFIAMVPAIIVAIVVGPMMIVKVLIVFAIEQTIESRVISPQVLGSNMAIHPVTIMLLLISAGSIFGVAGVIFVIPIYAVIKVMFSHFFVWYKRVSGLYLEEEGILEDAISEDTPGK
ncbi:AI-2E family transporter [Aerococcus urinaeequi]|uniref:AI-2E family transporter n=1 Tax=Aerococcus urinaeequi TaxID=51665 RepID=UPI002891D99B|nr:AI-2E family transporter [Aerococcus urinaeequi]MDT2760921.1 AI-2E family transporter [Aerococcus urinaeequi]